MMMPLRVVCEFQRTTMSWQITIVLLLELYLVSLKYLGIKPVGKLTFTNSSYPDLLLAHSIFKIQVIIWKFSQ